MIEKIKEHKKPEIGLSYATRLFITHYFRSAATDIGHQLAGHGLQDSHIKLLTSIKNLFNS